MLVSQEAEAYASRYSSGVSPLLQEILDYTYAHHPHSQMISGREQGLLLQFFSRIMQPKRILEIGTFTGFSGLCLAEGLAAGGELHTIELRQADADIARAYFSRSPLRGSIHLHLGDANLIIPTLRESWDLVFIDADKSGYIGYYEMVLPLLRPGGLIIADNVLFHGEVLLEPLSGKNAKAIAAFNEHVHNDSRTEQLVLTVRDGLMLIRKRV